MFAHVKVINFIIFLLKILLLNCNIYMHVYNDPMLQYS